jgi:DNA polymerase phi
MPSVAEISMDQRDSVASPSATQNSSSSLALYWELASLDSKTRINSAAKLIHLLKNFQSEFEKDDKKKDLVIQSTEDLDNHCAPDMTYALKRLIRGLPSSRQGARQGFSVTLTEVIFCEPQIKWI